MEAYRNIAVLVNNLGALAGLSDDVGRAPFEPRRIDGIYLEPAPTAFNVAYRAAGVEMGTLTKQLDQHRHRVESAFIQRFHRHGCPLDFANLRKVSGRDAATLNASDIVVVPAPRLSTHSASHVGELEHTPTANVIGTLGRPVLVCPKPVPGERTNFAHVVIAWNGAKEVARAVCDALPFLRAARKVDILRVGKDRADTHNVQALIGLLSRHGVNASTRRLERTASTADAILSAASEADLLVAGARRRERFGQVRFGGSTATLLRALSTPTLFSN